MEIKKDHNTKNSCWFTSNAISEEQLRTMIINKLERGKIYASVGGDDSQSGAINSKNRPC